MLENGVPEFIVNRERRFSSKRTSSYLETFVDKDGVERQRIRFTNQGRFCDEKKRLFLEFYSATNRIREASDMAGVSLKTVREHIASDPEFGEAVMEAEQSYRDHVVAHIQDLCFNGVEKKVYDRNGNLVSEEIQYPVKLIEMEGRRVEPGYRDYQHVSVTHGGGVLVAPASLGTIEEWQKKFGENALDVTYEEVKKIPTDFEKEKVEE